MIARTRLATRDLLRRRMRIANHLNAHPDSALNLDLDECYRVMAQELTALCYSEFVRSTGALNLPTVPVATGESYATLPVPTDCVMVQRIETQDSAQLPWRPADRATLATLREFALVPGQRNTGAYAMPYSWTMADQGLAASAGLAAPSAGSILLAPVPSVGRYQIWYLPEFAALSADSGAAGVYHYPTQAAADLHLLLACELVAISDNDAQSQLAGVEARLSAARELVRSSQPVAGAVSMRRSARYWG